MKKRIPIMGIILLLLLTSLSFPTSSTVENQSNTIYVDDNGTADYTTIQDAIDNASEGDTVFVYDGIYNEKIEIKKSIILQGLHKYTTIIDGKIILKTDNIHITGFTIRNGNNGIHSFEKGNHIISDNIIEDCDHGIDLTASKNNKINNNTFLKNKIGIFLLGYFDDGSNSNEIKNNIFRKNKKGIELPYQTIMFYLCRSNIITYNSFIMNTCGIYIDGDHEYNIISKNNFINNIKGVFFRYSLGAFNPFFNGNDISQNYWNRPRSYPKLIYGYIWAFPWFITDSDPSKTAYDI